MSQRDDSIRLQKFLSTAGVCSRRTAEEFMNAGRVKVNGKVCAELGTKVTPGKDKIEVDGKLVTLPDSFIYILMNKPPNVITSLEDPEGRPIVIDLLPPNMPRIWPVGRLDWDSEGVLLLTNDGTLTNLLTHPSHDITKEYAVKVQGLLPQDAPKLEELRTGVDIGDDTPTRPAHVRVSGTTGRNTWLEVIIGEGRNRQVRRMFEAIGHPVMKLRRLRIGPLTIDGLSSGSYRSLNADEVYSLYQELEAKIPKEARPSKRQKKRAEEGERPVVRRENKPRHHTKRKASPAKRDENASSRSSADNKPSRGGSDRPSRGEGYTTRRPTPSRSDRGERKEGQGSTRPERSASSDKPRQQQGASSEGRSSRGEGYTTRRPTPPRGERKGEGSASSSHDNKPRSGGHASSNHDNKPRGGSSSGHDGKPRGGGSSSNHDGKPRSGGRPQGQGSRSGGNAKSGSGRPQGGGRSNGGKPSGGGKPRSGGKPGGSKKS